MVKLTAVLFAVAATCVFCAGCEKETSGGTMTPAVPLGLVIGTGQSSAQPEGGRDVAQEEYDLVMLWGDGKIAADLYDVFRSTGDGPYARLNEDLIRRSPFLGIPNAPIGLGFVDGTFDISSPLTYSYIVVAANSRGEVSDPSEKVTLVPADYDPSATVTGLTPSDAFSVPVGARFSWDPVPGASSYCVVLMEIRQIDDGTDEAVLITVPVWIYRTSETSASLTSAGGVTYLDGAGKTLRSGMNYTWGVFAVNANNSSFASSFVEFATDRFVATVVDSSRGSGPHTVFWNEKDYTGRQVPAGGYELRFSTANYDTTLNFEIVPGLAEADSRRPGRSSGQAMTSDGTFVELASYTPALGDSVEVHYFLPARINVLIQIYAEER